MHTQITKSNLFKIFAKLYELWGSEKIVTEQNENYIWSKWNIWKRQKENCGFFPDITVQETVVTKIELRLSVCDSMEQTVVTVLQQAEAMRFSILIQAFKGEFVASYNSVANRTFAITIKG